MPENSKKKKAPKRFYFRLPPEYAQLNEQEQEAYLDFFAQEIWKTVTTQNQLEKGKEIDE
jgi:hypothetical protein